MIIFAVSFGELDVSPLTIGLMVGFALFTFLAVGLSSFSLIQSLFDDKE